MLLDTPAEQVGRAAAADIPPARLGGRRLLAARAAWLLVALLSIGIFAAQIPYAYAGRQYVCAGSACADEYLSPQDAQAIAELGFTTADYASYVVALDTLFALGYVAVGALIFWRKSDDRMALFAALALVLFGSTWPLAPNLLSGAPAALQLLARLWVPLGFAALGLLIYTFPDGRFVPSWTRWLALLALVWPTSAALLPGSPIDSETWPPLLRGPISLALFGTLVFAPVYRYVRVSGPIQRQQTKWVAFGVAITVGGGAAYLLTSALFPGLDAPGRAHILYFDLIGRTLFGTVTLLLIPIAIAIAILRYRLWEIDILINRALVYSTLSAAISGIYVVVVGALGALFQARGNLLIALIGAGVVAVLFGPLRDRLARGVNRLLYGERDEPYAVLSRLGQRLGTTFAPNEVLPAIVVTVRDALKLPYVAIALRQDGQMTVVAETGDNETSRQAGQQIGRAETPISSSPPLLVSLALTYQGEHVGELHLAPRAGEVGFSAADRRLLDDLARQAGVAAHAVRLTADLQRSRERLVTAREEERRRLRRDLHDGLGPALATQVLKLEAARELVSADPARADALLADLVADSQAAIADIRRLVYALRPPALDEFGLVGAIREHAAQFQSTGALRIVVDAPERLPALPAATEVAAFRITLEALNNVVNHAAARTCVISLGLGNGLHLDIRDDGRGIPAARHSGVGLASMRERAAELGGSCAIGPAPGGGTCVTVWLPLTL